MINNTFPKTVRLRTNLDFKSVFHGSKRFSAGKLTAFCQRNELRYPRLGLSIGRKKVRFSADRNVIKRATREKFRHSKAALDGLDMVLVAGKMPKKVNKIEVNQWLDALFKQLIDYYSS